MALGRLGHFHSQSCDGTYSESMNIELNLNTNDKPVWTLNQSGLFTVSSAWDVQRQKKVKNWFDANTWHKKVPLKMSFILWRVVRDKIPTDSRLAKMGIAMLSRCTCCKSPQKEDIDYFSSSREFATKSWRLFVVL